MVRFDELAGALLAVCAATLGMAAWWTTLVSAF